MAYTGQGQESDDTDCLKLENQLCFPLYVCAKEVVKRYRPLLDPFDLTYTQYIVMMVLWSEKQINVKTLGERLYLDSGTLTPLLKKLESKGYVKRERALQDERNLNVTITEEGERLKILLQDVPGSMAKCVCLEPKEAAELRRLLDKILRVIK
ncbi:MAG: MarR family transcriptional regulator [Lachnospiraceae bacterium]|nr:MarR family transcriptional regulator [Lachnospiraceae bacterium]